MQLVGLYHVSRQTVRQALALLAEDGIMEKRQGRESRVTDCINRTSHSIAVVSSYVDDYIFPFVLHRAEEQLEKQGYSTHVYSTQNQLGREREIMQELELFLRQCPQFRVFRISAGLCAVLVKADEGRVRRETDFCLQTIRRRFDSLESGCEWYVACGGPANRLSDVAGSFHEADRILSYRHLCTGQHELTAESLAALRRNDTGKLAEDLELSALSPSGTKIPTISAPSSERPSTALPAPTVQSTRHEFVFMLLYP